MNDCLAYTINNEIYIHTVLFTQGLTLMNIMEYLYEKLIDYTANINKYHFKIKNQRYS